MSDEDALEGGAESSVPPADTEPSRPPTILPDVDPSAAPPIVLDIPPTPAIPVIEPPPQFDREASTLRPHESQDAAGPMVDSLDGIRSLLEEQNRHIAGLLEKQNETTAGMIGEHEKREVKIAQELREEVQKDREWLASRIHTDFLEGVTSVTQQFWEAVQGHTRSIAQLNETTQEHELKLTKLEHLFARVDTLESELKDVKTQLAGLLGSTDDT